MSSPLIWTPTSDALFKAVENNNLSIAISPFIKTAALIRLLEKCNDASTLQVVSSWNKNHLLSCTTDADVFPLLESVGARFFIHPSIHLKLFVLSENRAFHTSSNITLSGLGLINNANIEVGCEVQLYPNDWLEIYQIIHESMRVDQQMYEQAIEYIDLNKNCPSTAPPLKLTPAENKKFSLDSLPLYPSPAELVVDCERINTSVEGIENRHLHAFAHDSALFKLDKSMHREILTLTLKNNFQSLPFVQAIIAFLKERESARFGLMTDWIQRNCSDKPLPYRSGIKETVHTLFTWLEYFYDEISWSVPGTHSMVIQWRVKGD